LSSGASDLSSRVSSLRIEVLRSSRPVWAILIIALDVLVIAALAAYGAEEAGAKTWRRRGAAGHVERLV
jgi:hypothetical protein